MTRRLAWFASPVGLLLALFVVLRGLAAPPFSIALRPLVTSGLDKPVYLTHAGDHSGRLFVVELEGRLRILRDGSLLGEPSLDLTSQVQCCQEQGLYSVAFDPEYEINGTFYVNYIDNHGDTVIERYVVPTPSADVANPITVTTVLVVDQPYFNHNGGQLQFSPRDGYLYIGMGDGGGPGDPDNRGQSLDSLLGKMLRIDVRGAPTYTIPPSNPFTQTPGIRPEIWAYGLRNPWRFSFDRVTSDLYIGDVGAVCHEEIIYEPAGGPGGRNYGWRRMEGFHAFNPQDAGVCNQPEIAPEGVTLPVIEYSHSPGFAVTGGYVYRGQAHPSLNGVYFYGDFGSGRIWTARQPKPGRWATHEILNTPHAISSFGEDENGELYVLSYGDGKVFQIVSAAPADE